MGRGLAEDVHRRRRSGAYLRVITSGEIQAGDEITVSHRPDHDVTVALFFRASMDQPGLLPRLLAAGDDLDPGARVTVQQYLARTGHA